MRTVLAHLQSGSSHIIFLVNDQRNMSRTHDPPSNDCSRHGGLQSSVEHDARRPTDTKQNIGVRTNADDGTDHPDSMGGY